MQYFSVLLAIYIKTQWYTNHFKQVLQNMLCYPIQLYDGLKTLIEVLYQKQHPHDFCTRRAIFSHL